MYNLTFGVVFMKGNQKKVIALIVAVFICLGVFAFKFDDIKRYKIKEDLKIALLLSDKLSTSDVENHSVAINKLSESYKIDSSKILIKENVSQNDCFDVVETAVGDGYNLIFSVGKDLEDYIVQSATEHPTVRYCIAESKQAILLLREM